MARRITSVLIDLSGTLYIGEYAIPGAVEALKKLRNADIKVRFVTNTTKESKRSLLDSLTKAGFKISQEEVFTSLTAASNLIREKKLRPFFLLSESALEDFQDYETSNPNAVVVGLSPESFHYENMTAAFRLIQNGAKLIAIHKSRYYKRSDGLALGPGAFVAGLEYATGVTAEVCGKPECKFFLSALEEINSLPADSVMIGDDARDDVKGAIDSDLLGILVKTGKYREGDELKFQPSPTHVCEDFSEAVDLIIRKYIDHK